MKLSWHGVPEFNRNLDQLVEDAQRAGRAFVEQGGHIVEKSIKRRAGEGGRHAKGTPTPASKGSGPAVISGTLRRSVIPGPVLQTSRTRFEGKIGPTAIYGRRVELEYGYPYVGPGLDDVIGKLRYLAVQLWSRGSGGGRRISLR